MAFNSTGVGLVHAMAHVDRRAPRRAPRHRQRHLPAARHPLQLRRARERYRDVAEALGVDARDLGDEMAGEAAAARGGRSSRRACRLPPRLRDVGVPEGDLAACAEGSLSDGAIVYNGKFAADQELVLGVYRKAY